MLEHVVQMGPMLIIGALMVGWLTETLSWAGGYGLIPDIALGLIGSAVAGAIAWGVVSGDPGMVAMFVIGSAGAALVIIGQRKLWHSTRPAA